VCDEVAWLPPLLFFVLANTEEALRNKVQTRKLDRRNLIL
jgi:hypothetical protein